MKPFISKPFISRSLVIFVALVACSPLARPTDPTPTPPSASSLTPSTASVPSMGQALPSLAPLVDAVKSAVVNVEVKSRAESAGQSGGEGADEFWEHFFGQVPGGNGQRSRPQPHEQLRQGLGSGFLIRSSGLVMTNNHVVQGAVAIQVKLDDGRVFEGEVLGKDPLTDVALIKLKGTNIKNLPSVKLGDSDAMRVGDWSLAIGNPFGLASSVSLGIISARARQIGAGPYDDFLQTDAAINPGNSGGPLFNMKGEVIGINTAIVGGGSGIGFAVPSNMVKALLPQLEKGEAVTRGWLGVSIQDLTPDLSKSLGLPVSDGALVSDVNAGTPADKAGLRADDVVVALDGNKIASSGALSRSVANKRPSSVSTLSVYRGGKKLEVKVTLGTRPNLEGTGPSEPGNTSDDTTRQKKLGLAFQDVDPRMTQGMPPEGALISEVLPSSPAEKADLRPGMVVVEAGGKKVKNAEGLAGILRHAKSGSTLLLRVQIQGGKVLRALVIPE